MNKVILAVFLLMGSGCLNSTNSINAIGSDSTSNNTTNDSLTRAKTAVDSSVSVISKLPNDSAVVINDTTKIEIEYLDKEIGKDSPHLAIASKYQAWNLDSASIVKMMRCAHPIDDAEFHNLYYVLKCNIIGKVKISGKPYKIEINAGSYFFLFNADPAYRDTAYSFGCSDNKCKKFFLHQGGDPKTDMEDSFND